MVFFFRVRGLLDCGAELLNMNGFPGTPSLYRGALFNRTGNGSKCISEVCQGSSSRVQLSANLAIELLGCLGALKEVGPTGSLGSEGERGLDPFSRLAATLQDNWEVVGG